MAIHVKVLDNNNYLSTQDGIIDRMRHGVYKGSANLATTSYVGLSTSLIVKHGVSDCTPQVISGPETLHVG